MLLQGVRAKYAGEDLQIQKKVQTLNFVNTVVAATGFLLGVVMVLTQAYAVALICVALLAFNALIYGLLQGKRHFLASNLLIFVLYFVMFSAIKFDAYVDVYETYVLATLGLVLLIITSLVSFVRWQIVVVTVLVLAGIVGLWWVDVFPTYGYVLDTLQIQNLVTSVLMVLLGSIAGLLLVRIQENLLFSTKEDRDRIKKMLSMTEIYTKKSLVSIIAEGKDPTKFVPVLMDRVILFCDIRDFTTLSEAMNSIDIVGFLNSFFSRMNKEIQAYGGEIDKLIGDCIMASFESKCEALNCAVAMRKHLQRYNAERIGFNLRPIGAGIGISYGAVVVGNIGSESKMDFTSIGDVVNSSSRIESLTKIYGVDILTSMPPEASSELQQDCRFIDNIRVKGKSEPISIFEIFAHEPDSVRAFKNDSNKRFQEAHLLYREGNFDAAEAIYDELIFRAGRHTYKPSVCSDPVLDFFKRRCQTLKAAANAKVVVDANWDGVFAF